MIGPRAEFAVLFIGDEAEIRNDVGGGFDAGKGWDIQRGRAIHKNGDELNTGSQCRKTKE